MLIDKFLEHPNEKGENYFQHLKEAFFISFLLIISSIACLIHGFLPFTFKNVATNVAKHILKKRALSTHKEQK